MFFLLPFYAYILLIFTGCTIAAPPTCRMEYVAPTPPGLVLTFYSQALGTRPLYFNGSVPLAIMFRVNVFGWSLFNASTTSLTMSVPITSAPNSVVEGSFAGNAITVSNFSMTADAWIRVPDSGNYTFIIQADNIALMTISNNASTLCDAAPFLDNNEVKFFISTVGTSSASVYLDAGIPYRMSLLYVHPRGSVSLAVSVVDAHGIFHADASYLFSQLLLSWPEGQVSLGYPYGPTDKYVLFNETTATPWTGTTTSYISVTSSGTMGTDNILTVTSTYFIATPTTVNTTSSEVISTSAVTSSSILSSVSSSLSQSESTITSIDAASTSSEVISSDSSISQSSSPGVFEGSYSDQTLSEKSTSSSEQSSSVVSNSTTSSTPSSGISSSSGEALVSSSTSLSSGVSSSGIISSSSNESSQDALSSDSRVSTSNNATSPSTLLSSSTSSEITSSSVESVSIISPLSSANFANSSIVSSSSSEGVASGGVSVSSILSSVQSDSVVSSSIATSISSSDSINSISEIQSQPIVSSNEPLSSDLDLSSFGRELPGVVSSEFASIQSSDDSNLAGNGRSKVSESAVITSDVVSSSDSSPSGFNSVSQLSKPNDVSLQPQVTVFSSSEPHLTVSGIITVTSMSTTYTVVILKCPSCNEGVVSTTLQDIITNNNAFEVSGPGTRYINEDGEYDTGTDVIPVEPNGVPPYIIDTSTSYSPTVAGTPFITADTPSLTNTVYAIPNGAIHKTNAGVLALAIVFFSILT